MADFNHFGEELAKVLNAAEAGMKNAVIKFEADTKALTHVQTGTLRRSWTHKVKSNANGTIEGAVGSNLEYAPYEDALHGNISTALDNNLDEYMNTISDEIKTAIGGS